MNASIGRRERRKETEKTMLGDMDIDIDRERTDIWTRR